MSYIDQKSADDRYVAVFWPISIRLVNWFFSYNWQKKVYCKWSTSLPLKVLKSWIRFWSLIYVISVANVRRSNSRTISFFYSRYSLTLQSWCSSRNRSSVHGTPQTAANRRPQGPTPNCRTLTGKWPPGGCRHGWPSTRHWSCCRRRSLTSTCNWPRTWTSWWGRPFSWHYKVVFVEIHYFRCMNHWWRYEKNLYCLPIQARQTFLPGKLSFLM